MLNDKKGKDYGIDGRVPVLTGNRQYRDVLFSVKSGSVNSSMLRDFRGTIERENAAAGVFITLKEPTRDMRQEAAAAGLYSNEYMRDVDKIKIVTVEQMLAGERLQLPLTADVLKRAEPALRESRQFTFAQS